MYFEIISNITNIEIIAIGNSIRDVERLRQQFGEGRWRKMKGFAKVRYKKESQFAVCLHNEGCDDPEMFKIYQIGEDEIASDDGYIRVVDESGEDYLYPKDYFLLLDVSKHTENVISTAYQQALSPA